METREKPRAERGERVLRRMPAQTLPELVYRELRSAILNGLFSPGQVLRQEEVADRLGVSRSPLREALLRLEGEGMVVLNPRRGYSVTTMTPAEVVEAFDLRILLEREMGRRSIRMRTAQDIEAVRSTLDEMAGLAIDSEGTDLAKWFELNARFHQQLLEPSGCRQHMRALLTSRGTIEAYVRAEVRFTGDLRQAQFEHGLLFSAFAAGDADTMLRLIREHSEHTRDRLLLGLARTDADRRSALG